AVEIVDGQVLPERALGLGIVDREVGLDGHRGRAVVDAPVAVLVDPVVAGLGRVWIHTAIAVVAVDVVVDEAWGLLAVDALRETAEPVAVAILVPVVVVGDPRAVVVDAVADL